MHKPGLVNHPLAKWKIIQNLAEIKTPNMGFCLQPRQHTMSYRNINKSHQMIIKACLIKLHYLTYWKVKPISIYRLMERPGKVVPPKRLLQGPLEVLELVGHATWPARILNWGVWWGGGALGHCVWQRWAFKVLIQQGGFANALARASVLIHSSTGQPNQRAKVRRIERPENRNRMMTKYLFFWF